MIRIIVYCNDCGARGFEGETHREARRASIRKGWTNPARGRDLCPTCTERIEAARAAYDAAHPEERGYF